MRNKNLWKIIKYPVPFLFITLIVLSFVISDCSNSLMEKIINSETTVHTGHEIAKYEIAISPSGNKFFGSVLENYTEPEPYIVTVVNTGNRNTGDIHVTISDADSGSFKLSASVIPGIDPGKSDFFSIVPKTGLALGVHTAAVTLTGDNGITAGLNVSINISAVPLVDIPDTDITIKAPVTAEVPDISVTDSAYFSISEQSWDPPDNPFKANKVYTAHVTLTANPGYTFTEETAIQINETTVLVADINREVMDINITGVQLMITYIFPKTVPLVIDSADITVTAPVTGDTPDATAKGTGNFKIGAVTWNPSDNPFTNSVNYTATVTLTANDNYSFEKLSSATINGNSAAIIENTGDELTLSYEFPKTLPVIIDSVDITISDPATGYAPNTMATGSGDFTIGEVTWDLPAGNTVFISGIQYSATVTLTANANFTFTGLSSAAINGNNTTITQTENTGTELTITCTFPPTTDTIEISTKEDLLSFLQSGNPDSDWLKRNYKLGADIELTPPSEPNGSYWTRIGDNSNPFTGSFDGNGYTISFLSIEESSTDYQGMFGEIGMGGQVKNITLVNCTIAGKNNTGGIAGENNGTVENCSITGESTITGLGDYYTGGIVGNNTSIIRNCYTTCTVSGIGPSTGGVAGNNTGTIQNCYSTSVVTGANTGNSNTGGIVGSNSSGVQNCVALNGGIFSNNNYGRIVGKDLGSKGLINNYGLTNMFLNGSAGTWTKVDATLENGADVNAGTGTGQYNNSTFWTGLGWDFTTVWYFDDSSTDTSLHLPRLQIEKDQ